MKKMKIIPLAGLLGLALTLSGTSAVIAQSAPSPSLKTIGTPSAAAKPEIVPSLFVLNSRGATLQGETLTLTGVTPSSIIFADRPVRAAGHQSTADVIAEWASGDDSFAKNPPNATVSVLGKDGSVKDAVVVLKNPKLDGDKLSFSVQTLEGDLAGGDGPAAVFHRHHRPAVHADVFCRRCPAHGVPRCNVCRCSRRGCIWRCCLRRALLSSVPASAGVWLLSLSALLLRWRHEIVPTNNL